jgi:hypothetical protein
VLKNKKDFQKKSNVSIFVQKFSKMLSASFLKCAVVTHCAVSSTPEPLAPL